MFINLETWKKRLRSTESGMCYSKELPVCKKRGNLMGGTNCVPEPYITAYNDKTPTVHKVELIFALDCDELHVTKTDHYTSFLSFLKHQSDFLVDRCGDNGTSSFLAH